MVINYPVSFVLNRQSFYQLRILCCYAGGACIFVALQSLYASERQHHTTGTVTRVGTQRKSPEHMKTKNYLPGSNHFYLSLQVETS